MSIHQIKLVRFLMFALGISTCGAFVWGRAPEEMASGPAVQPNRPPAALTFQSERPAIAKAKADHPEPGQMFVTGRVLDPDGNPVKHASVMVYTRPRLMKFPNRSEAPGRTVKGRAASDDMGQFRLELTRSSSAADDELAAVAFAPGYGIGWTDLDPDAEQPVGEITLQAEQLVPVRLFDLQGRPASGVTVRVTAIQRVLHESPDSRFPNVEGPLFARSQASDLPAWPQPSTTDRDGRFLLRGVGRGLRASLTIVDPRYAQQSLEIHTNRSSDAKPLSFALEPAKMIHGRVTYADTGQPVPKVRVFVMTSNSSGQSAPPTYFEADTDGRFRANPPPGDRYSVGAYPPEGTPYLRAAESLTWPKGAVDQSVNISLPRGTLMHGKVTQAVTGKPIVGANVIFIARPLSGISDSFSETASDGSFAFGVKPGPGYLIVMAPSDDYQLVEFGQRLIRDNKPGGQRNFAHAFIAYEPKPGVESPEIHVPLQPGVTVKGRLVGPDNQPIQDARILSPFAMKTLSGSSRSWRQDLIPTARNGHYQLHGLGPDTEVAASFLEPKLKLGATIKVSGKLAKNGPMDIQLEPCGKAKARLVNPKGKPVSGFGGDQMILMVVAPGPTSMGRNGAEDTRLLGILAPLVGIDPLNYQKAPVSDAHGSIVLPVLIPGATYQIRDPTMTLESLRVRAHKEFTVKPGETLDLGDFLIERPERRRRP